MTAADELSRREAPLDREKPDRVVRIGLLGCGNVGAAFLRLLDEEGPAIATRTGTCLDVTAIGVRRPAEERPGIDMRRGGRLVTSELSLIATDPAIDVVVELLGGIEPAQSVILRALQNRKPVVTANKELVAHHGSGLMAAADEAGVDLLFEAAVGGALPLVRLLRESLAGENVTRVSGIVNGTTNFVLTEMSEKGCDLAEALEDARRRGFAESDPRSDLEGDDAASKAAILAGLAFDADVVARDVHREGIVGVRSVDITFARQLGYEVKLLALAERVSSETLAVRVHPAMLLREHPLASVRGPFNAVFVEGESSGELMVLGRGAGGRPTASAVLGDVLEVSHHLGERTRGRRYRRRPTRLVPMTALSHEYYLSLDVSDEPGVLAAVAASFGRHGVSIRSMEQVGLGDEARLVFITHTALEADFTATLDELGALESVKEIGCFLRVVGNDR